MRKILAAAVALATLAACEQRGEGAGHGADSSAAGNEHSGTDTVVTSTTVKDTTVIRADTTIDVDTVRATNNAEKVGGGRDTTAEKDRR